MQFFRITTEQHTDDAFTGEGARLYGGRWNPKGISLIYTAATRSLALLEMLVQDQPLRANYVLIAATLPDDVRTEQLTTSDLPRNWRSLNARPTLQKIGMAWLQRNESAVLIVPSVVIPQENNFLLNPRHADFARLKTGIPEVLDTDSRLLRHSP
jgi:RES domain-containing protein